MKICAHLCALCIVFAATNAAAPAFAACAPAGDSTGANGSRYWDSAASNYKVCINTAWVAFTLSDITSTSCSTASQIEYDSTNNYFTVCAGSGSPVWKKIDCVADCGAGGSDVTSGLIHKWKLDENPPGSTATDSIGANNGSNSGTPIAATGMLDGAYDFGASDYSEIGDLASIEGKTTLTMSAWMKRRSTNAKVLIGRESSIDGSYAFALQYWDGNVECAVAPSSAYASGYFALNDTSWHLITMTYDGAGSGNSGRLKCYKDGVAQTLTFTGTIPASTPSSTYTFSFGILSAASGATTASNGFIDDVRIYNRVLTPTEVTDLYNFYTGVPPCTLEGQIEYFGTNKLKYCDGSYWRTIVQ